MKILILEDDPNRVVLFKKHLCAYTVYYTDTVDGAVELLKEHEDFDIYFLDHDLGGEVYVDSMEKNTGFQFAKILSKRKTRSPIIIHSMNPIGAENMAQELRNKKVYKLPFHIFVDNGELEDTVEYLKEVKSKK